MKYAICYTFNPTQPNKQTNNTNKTKGGGEGRGEEEEFDLKEQDSMGSHVHIIPGTVHTVLSAKVIKLHEQIILELGRKSQQWKVKHYNLSL